MAAAESNVLIVQQLSHQLHVVSEIAESLTLRLITLEERFEQLHQQSSSDLSDPEQDEASRRLLDHSGDRLRHLQGLLAPGSLDPVIAPDSLSDDEIQTASVDDVIPDDEGLAEFESSLNETVYVDDPQIDHADHDVHEQLAQDQFSLLSA